MNKQELLGKLRCVATNGKDEWERGFLSGVEIAIDYIEEFDEPTGQVQLTEKQAELVRFARLNKEMGRLLHIASDYDEEKLLIEAYINGFTVREEPRYYVHLIQSSETGYLSQVLQNPFGYQFTFTSKEHEYGLKKAFTEAEIKEINLVYWHESLLELAEDEEC